MNLDDNYENSLEQKSLDYTGSKSKEELKEIIDKIVADYNCEFFSNDYDFIDGEGEDHRDEYQSYTDNQLYYIIYRINEEEYIRLHGGIDKDDFYGATAEVGKFHIKSGMLLGPARYGEYAVNFGVNKEFYVEKIGRYDETKIPIKSADCYSAFSDEVAAKKFLSLVVVEDKIGVTSRMNPPKMDLDKSFFL